MTTTVDHDLRVLIDHDPECFLRYRDDAFVMHDGMEWDRKRNGYKGGSTAFHRFRCNDPKCPAILLVNVVWLADRLAEYVSA